MADNLPVLRVVGWSKRRRHPFGVERYMQVSYIGLDELSERIRDHTLGAQAVSVLLSMMACCDYENRVLAGQKDLAKHLGMAQSHVSKAIVSLIEAGFVERGENYRGRYVISPRLAWKGGEESLRVALAARGMLDDKGMLRGRAA